jgi:hypothetical protein
MSSMEDEVSHQAIIIKHGTSHHQWAQGHAHVC